MLNEQVSSWVDVTSGVPLRSILSPLLNDLADKFSSNTNVFVKDRSLISVVHDINTYPKEMNSEKE